MAELCHSNEAVQRALAGAKQRFLEKCIEDGNGCWIWSSTVRVSDGYALFWFRGKNVRASRVSLLMFKGIELGELCALHTCDNPLCVNPDHLFVGTRKDNAIDMASKKRQRLQVNPELSRGTNNNQAKLDADKVLYIRSECARGVSQSAMARFYGVTPDAINKIIKRKNWIHI